MQEPLYLLLRELLESLRAVTAELHRQHAADPKGTPRALCREESCQSLSQAEAQADSLRRALGISSFR